MNIRLILTLIFAAIVLAAISVWMGQQAYAWLPPPAAAESKMVDDLFSFLVALGSFIFLGVTGAIVYSILFHRAGKYDYSDGPPIEGNVTLEIVWTVIPILLVFWIAGISYQTYERMATHGPMEIVHLHVPGMEEAYAVAIEDTIDPDESIEVRARQWAWEFRYPKGVTSTELHLPVNQRVHLNLVSEDVIHGFYVPAFRLKQDMIPDRTIDFEFTPVREGRYRLRDSQYSGTYFATMQTDVVVESEAAYESWLADASGQNPAESFNQAADEFYRASQKSVIPGWKTIAPAPAPVVNYPTSVKDSQS
jgi:cytochrome c oxidase subunit II